MQWIGANLLAAAHADLTIRHAIAMCNERHCVYEGLVTYQLEAAMCRGSLNDQSRVVLHSRENAGWGQDRYRDSVSAMFSRP